MKLHKTPQDRRNTYTYQFYDADGNPEPRITITPGEDGITEVDVKRLHAFDDSEVYYNIKARRPQASDAEKAQRIAWQEQYIEHFTQEHGYAPHPQDVTDALKQAFPKNWIASLDAILGDGDDDDLGDKGALFFSACMHDDLESSLLMERLQEIFDALPEKEKTVYQRVLLEGERKCDVAADLGISDVRVSQIAKKIQARIASDKILQSFFR